MPEGLTLLLLAMASLFSGGLIGMAMVRRRAGRMSKRIAGAEARTKAILDAAVDGVVIIDEAGRIHALNRGAENIFGYSEHEVLGCNVSMLMPEPYRSQHDTYLHNYLTTGKARIIGLGREVIGLRKDGTTFPMDLAVGESRLGDGRIFAGTVRDITERKAVEERLRASEDRFRILVEGVRDYAITMLDPGGVMISWNLGAVRIYGWDASEVLGTSIARFYPIDEIAQGEPDRSLATAAREGRYETEGWRLRKDGSKFWCHIITTALRDDVGALKGFARIAQDVTAHKYHEDALRRAKDEAETARASAEAAKEVAEQARAEAERANMAKTRFLAAASHDLRQPVQAIFFFTSVLAHKLRNDPSARIIDDLQASVEGLNMLLDSLLDISKLDAGLVLAKEADFSVASIFDRVAAEYHKAASDKGVLLKVVGSTAIVRSDPALLSRIVQNLMSNAIRYTANGKILLGCRRRAGRVIIQVWDTGIGIPNDRRRDIFEEFTQLGNPERDRSQGLGLGLAIVKRLAALLGHAVDVHSIPGKGSVFSIEVPVAAGAQIRSRTIAPTPGHVDGTRLVVLIDDEPIVLKGLTLVLQSWGYDVLAATSEFEAIEKLAALRREPSLILADYRLREGHTGTEAVANIRTLFKTQIPSIIITGDTAPERLREAEASGLSILHKPIQPPTLREIVSATLARTAIDTVH